MKPAAVAVIPCIGQALIRTWRGLANFPVNSIDQSHWNNNLYQQVDVVWSYLLTCLVSMETNIPVQFNMYWFYFHASMKDSLAYSRWSTRNRLQTNLWLAITRVFRRTRHTIIQYKNSNSTMSWEGWLSYMSSLLGARMTLPLRVWAWTISSSVRIVWSSGWG